MAEQPFDEEIICATRGFTQPFQQKPGIRDANISAETLSVGIKRDKESRME